MVACSPSSALLLSGDPHRAEELVQATFERTYRSWRRARDGEPRAYARRILLNLRIDGWRRSRTRSFAIFPTPTDLRSRAST
ncbi:sigma factor [Promicromonospora soli]|uniref:RNA polymerase sigma-70 region 2 domain-containing protein n=1 Tax=Promicromonospora soli TaxID=2035533 RepID=A0A919KSH0_9MICO|nr:sigma factor [Promicromonospora soli]GHH70722.1 hypothetical protein GCM10017772_17780 [Promicromonospora soli]